LRILNQVVLIFAVNILLSGCSLLEPEFVETASRVNPYSDPQQASIQSGSSIQTEGLFSSCTLQPRAAFVMQGRILHTRQYDLDWRSVCSPLDLAIGWGPMADPAVDQWITWSQSRRWYFYRLPGGAPVSVGEVALHSSNVHIIPATNNISRALLKLDRGDVVQLEGDLVDATVNLFGLPFETRTSLSRSDTGAGACEILYVRRLVVDGREYR
jgi:hypothetical protein